MREEIVDVFFRKTMVEPWVKHLYGSIIEEAIFLANENNKKVMSHPKKVVDEIKSGTYIVFNNGETNEDIITGYISDEKPKNRISLSLTIDELKKTASENIQKDRIHKDNVFMVDNGKPEMLFITTLIESSFEKNNLYNHPVFTGKNNTATFILSTFVDEFIIEHPTVIIKEENSNKYGIAPSNIYFMSDADSGEILSVWSTQYGMILEFKNGMTIQDLVSENKLQELIDDSVYKINNYIKNNIPFKATEDGNKILH